MGKQSLTIGIHALSTTDHTSRLLTGALRYVSEHGTLNLRDFRYARNDPHLVGNPPWTGKVDGAIVGMARDPGAMAWLKRGRVPVVIAAGDLADLKLVSVFTDVNSIARLAADHLFAAGYRHVVYVGAHNSAGSHWRRKALTAEFSRREMSLLSYDVKMVFTGTYEDLDTFARAERKFVAQLKKWPKPLGVVTVNDAVAAAVVGTAERLGFAVPAQVGVLGVDDSAVARLSEPPISSIRTPGEEIGYRCAALVHGMIQGHEPQERVVEIPATQLSVRQSTVAWERAPVTNIEKAVQYIRAHACEGIHIRDVSQAVHVPVRTLEVEFKAGVGRSIGEMIREERLNRAKSLLETTDLSTQRIADLVGYSHYSYLNKLLREELNLSPGEYRKKHRRKKQ